ncbi:MAG: ABC transporter ATP-binding protein [Pseudomonadota bacterium]|nr:ABC transporter ATP-binding protein [Pseudomonadota bacterium]|tara:strand:- start:577 stop:1275 length:699 start_codon:yes stop_codon:yes gene_type:complete
MILKLDEIHTYYGLVHMLQGVSLEIAEGEVVAILGRNGAGKTTALKSIMGLAPARQGKILFEDQDITDLPPHLIARQGIAYVPASRGIFMTLTSMENLNIVRTRGARWDTEDVFRRFPKLAPLKRRRGRSLSGGEQQMLAIGRALVTGPSLILLDEPSQGLAPMVVELVVNMLRELKSEGVSMLLVEQNLQMALDLAERVYILDQGEVVFDGSAQELKNNDQLTASYLGVSG